MTVLKETLFGPGKTLFPHMFHKNPISFTLMDFVYLEKEFLFAVPNKRFLIPFKTYILNLWSCFIVEFLGRPERNILFNVPLITDR